MNEVRAIIPPVAPVTRSGFRRRMTVQPDELRRLAVPTLLVWGEHEPLGSVAVAQAVVDLVPDARLEVLRAGHAPWLGCPVQTAKLVADFCHDARTS